MALTQENVHYTLNSDPDVMNKSNRVHARIQEFWSGRGGGGGGGGDRGPTTRKQSGQCFFLVSNLFYSLQSGSNGFITEGWRGVQLLPGRGPTTRKQSGQCFFSQQPILQFTEWIQWFYYRGEEGGPTSSRGWGCPKKHI